jgi:putative membrane protein insertion efficiency factor
MVGKGIARWMVKKMLATYSLLSPCKAALFGAQARCRFSPSCAAYARACVERHGVCRALPLILNRILRCNPWSRGGDDPVH